MVRQYMLRLPGRFWNIFLENKLFGGYTFTKMWDILLIKYIEVRQTVYSSSFYAMGIVRMFLLQ